VYYGSTKPHPRGQILFPPTGATLSASPTISAQASSSNSTISHVHFVGLYHDYDWDGNGIFREWQYQYGTPRKPCGLYERHMGTDSSGSGGVYSVLWNNEWIPDQSEPMSICAYIKDGDGICYVTPAVEDIKLERPGYSVKMYNTPWNADVRTGSGMSTNIQVSENPSTAASAKLVISTWSALESGTQTSIKLNGTVIAENFGASHNYSLDIFDVPLKALKEGANTFTIYSGHAGHAAEVNWPGPAILVASGEMPVSEIDPGRGRAAVRMTQPLKRAATLLYCMNGRKLNNPLPASRAANGVYFCQYSNGDMQGDHPVFLYGRRKP
jgi:hypothetical protein